MLTYATRVQTMPVHELVHYNLDRKMSESYARAVIYALPERFCKDQQVSLPMRH